MFRTTISKRKVSFAVSQLKDRHSSKVGIVAFLVTILAQGAFGVDAQSNYSELLSGVRIGMLHPSGIVVWPIDTSPDEAEWFGERNSGIRDTRRRQAEKMTDHAIMAWPGFRSLKGMRVTVVIDGKSMHSIVRGIARIPAGCGEFEPSWYASTTGYLTEPSFMLSEKPKIYSDWHPVLVLTEKNLHFSIHRAEPMAELPKELARELTIAGFPIVELEITVTKDLWTIYSDRITKPARSGAIRTTWHLFEQKFLKVHEATTNTTIERYIDRAYSNDPEYQELKLSFYRDFVGRIHALLETEETTIFLTKYQGWESDRAKLERFHDGQLQTLRVDGFDRGC